jgi:hypothetical protein
MSKRVAQSLTVNDPKCHDEIVFDRDVVFVDHILAPQFVPRCRIGRFYNGKSGM